MIHILWLLSDGCKKGMRCRAEQLGGYQGPSSSAPARILINSRRLQQGLAACS